MMTFWSGNYRENEFVLLKSAIEDSIDILRKKVDCYHTDSCKTCEARYACADLHKLVNHLEEISSPR